MKAFWKHFQKHLTDMTVDVRLLLNGDTYMLNEECLQLFVECEFEYLGTKISFSSIFQKHYVHLS